MNEVFGCRMVSLVDNEWNSYKENQHQQQEKLQRVGNGDKT